MPVIEQFRLPLQVFNHSSAADLSSSSVENLCPRRCFSNLETDGNHLVPGQENMVDDALNYCSLSNMRPVSRCIVVQKQGYMSQLSSALLFNNNNNNNKQICKARNVGSWETNLRRRAVSDVSQHSRPPVIVTLCGI